MPCAQSCLFVLCVTADFSQKGSELGKGAGSHSLRHRAPSELEGELGINNKISYRVGTRNNHRPAAYGERKDKGNGVYPFLYLMQLFPERSGIVTLYFFSFGVLWFVVLFFFSEPLGTVSCFQLTSTGTHNRGSWKHIPQCSVSNKKLSISWFCG